MAKMNFSIAGIGLSLEADPVVIDAVGGRLGTYCSEKSADYALRYELTDRIPHSVYAHPIATRRGGSVQFVQRELYELVFDQEQRQVVVKFAADGWESVRQFLFYQSLKPFISYELLMRGGVLFHASAVVQARQAVLFAGVSGAGKSTIASFYDEAAVVNDDMVALSFDDQGELWVDATPFTGTLDLQTRPGRFKVERGFLLSKGDSTAVQPISDATAFRGWLRSITAPGGLPEIDELAFAVAKRLQEKLNLQSLTFTAAAAPTRAFLNREVWHLSEHEDVE